MGPFQFIKRNRKLLLEAYICFFTIRMMIFLILGSIYTTQLQLLSSEKMTKQDKQAIGNQNELIYKWMMLMGAHYRSLKATSILCYSIYVFLIILYHLSPTFLPKYFMRVDEIGPIQLVQAPALSTKLTSHKLNTILKRLMVSNLNFIRSVQPRSGSITKAARKMSLINQKQINVSPKLEKQINENMLENQREKTKQEVTKLSYQQFQHLMHLSKNLDSIWPHNRNPAWAKRLEHYSVITLLTSFCFVYCGSQIASLVAQNLVHRSINDVKSVTHRALSQWNLMDRITLIEDSLMIWFVAQKFIIPLTLLVMITKDQSYYLKELTDRFEKLYGSMMSINEPESLLAPRSDLFKDFQHACDNEALELYIMFQYFNLEQRNNLKLGSIIINQYVYFVSAVSVTNLIILSSIESKYFSLMLLLSIVIVVVTNCVFCLGAAINSDTMKAVRLAFGLLANSQRYGNKLERKLWFEETVVDKLFKRSNLDRLVHRTEMLLLSPDLSFNCLISPHTILLWQRMVQDYKHSTERYACSVLGLMHIDYKAILRFNFWVLSASMLLVSNIYLKPITRV